MVAHTITLPGRAVSHASPASASSPDPHEYDVETSWSSSRAYAPGSGLQGDDFSFPFVLGYSGYFTADMADYTTEGWEVEDHSIWFRKWAPTTGTLKIEPLTPEASIQVTVWDGEDFYDLEQVYNPLTGEPEGAFTFEYVVADIETTPTRRIRFASSTAVTLEFQYTFTESFDTLALDVVVDTISASPGVIRVSVLNADPGEVIRFRVVGYPAFTFDLTADSNGIIHGASVQIPRGLAAGTYVLRGDSLSTSKYGEINFQITGVPAYPLPPEVDADPTPITQTGVRKWAFQDPMAGGLGQYLFALNPDFMSDPFPERYVTTDRTKSFAGQWIVWEGAERAVPWRFSGICETQAMYEALLSWRTCKRRIHIHDQHNRAFLVRIKGIALTPDRKPGYPYRHRYEVKADVFGWVQL